MLYNNYLGEKSPLTGRVIFDSFEEVTLIF